jgi:hypothetical protein
MAKQSKAKSAKKQATRKRREPAQSGKLRTDQGGSKFERAFAKIVPPKGFSIKKP